MVILLMEVFGVGLDCFFGIVFMVGFILLGILDCYWMVMIIIWALSGDNQQAEKQNSLINILRAIRTFIMIITSAVCCPYLYLIIFIFIFVFVFVFVFVLISILIMFMLDVLDQLSNSCVTWRKNSWYLAAKYCFFSFSICFFAS